MFISDTYVKSYCVRELRRTFQCKFQGVTIQNRKTVHAIINEIRQMGSLFGVGVGNRIRSPSVHWKETE
jgi:hypothetical protein